MVMTLPSVIFLLSCHDYYRRYFFRPPEENSLSSGRMTFPRSFGPGYFGPGLLALVSFHAGSSDPGTTRQGSRVFGSGTVAPICGCRKPMPPGDTHDHAAGAVASLNPDRIKVGNVTGEPRSGAACFSARWGRWVL